MIAYASRSLHPSERNDSNYSSFKLKLLAMKWAIVEKFKDYLWCAKITVVTDNNPLVHLQTAKLGAVEQRWVAQLSNFDYTIKHRPGRDHTNADVLSRFPVSPTDPITASQECEDELLVRAVEAPDTGWDSSASWGWDPARWKQEDSNVAQKDDTTLCQVQGYLEQGGLPDAKQRLLFPQPVRRLLN